MAKTFKRIFVGVFSAIAFLVAGLFFAGCEEDYSNVSVTSDVASLSLEVGETETLNFQINNAPSSFLNNLIFNVDNEGKIEISNKVIKGNVISVDITALEGGSVNLMAVTEDDFIYTFVQINIIEHSESMEYNSSFLYYTYTTPFVANDGIFNFDANTTDRDVTFYFLKEDVSVKDGVIETKNTKIAELEKVDIEKIKEQEYERGKTDGSVELDNFKKTNALKNSIKGAKDFDLVKTKLDLDKIKYEKDEKGEYKVSGVDEQINDIKEKYSFLFDEEDGKKDINLGGEHKKTTETDGLEQLEEAMGIKTEK